MSGGTLERIVLIVDAANVMGARPDGWWRDRAGAAERIITRVARLVERGLPASAFRRTGEEHTTRRQETGRHQTRQRKAEQHEAQRRETEQHRNGWHQAEQHGEQHAEPSPDVIPLEAIIVLEGAAKPAIERAAPAGELLAGGRLRLVAAAGSGDDEIVEQARSEVDADPARSVLVATSDRQLRERLASLGARCMGAGTFRALLPGPEPAAGAGPHRTPMPAAQRMRALRVAPASARMRTVSGTITQGTFRTSTDHMTSAASAGWGYDLPPERAA